MFFWPLYAIARWISLSFPSKNCHMTQITKEMLHQLKTLVYPIIYRVSRCFSHPKTVISQPSGSNPRISPTIAPALDQPACFFRWRGTQIALGELVLTAQGPGRRAPSGLHWWMLRNCDTMNGCLMDVTGIPSGKLTWHSELEHGHQKTGDFRYLSLPEGNPIKKDGKYTGIYGEWM